MRVVLCGLAIVFAAGCGKPTQPVASERPAPPTEATPATTVQVDDRANWPVIDDSKNTFVKEIKTNVAAADLKYQGRRIRIDMAIPKVEKVQGRYIISAANASGEVFAVAVMREGQQAKIASISPQKQLFIVGAYVKGEPLPFSPHARLHLDDATIEDQ